jgi:hypothetical protein
MLENTIFIWAFLVIFGPSHGIYFIYIYGDNFKLIRIIVLKYHFQYLLSFNAKNKVHLVSIQKVQLYFDNCQMWNDVCTSM